MSQSYDVKELIGYVGNFIQIFADGSVREAIKDAVRGKTRHTSDKLRYSLMELVHKASLPDDGFIVLCMLVTLSRDKARLLAMVSRMSKEAQDSDGVRSALIFIRKYTVTSVTAEKLGSNIALVHVAQANSFACTFFWKYFATEEMKTVDGFLASRFATQLNLTRDLIEINKRHMRDLCSNSKKSWIVKGSHTPNARFDEDSFEALAADQDPLSVVSSEGSLRPWKFGSVYDRKDLERWLKFPTIFADVTDETYGDDDIALPGDSSTTGGEGGAEAAPEAPLPTHQE